MSGLCGAIALNKPAGITSRRAIDAVAKLVRPAKVGHAGTLDPLATGVLVTCIGQATRLIEYIQDLQKEYLATFLLGRTSDTEDIEGSVRELPDPPKPTQLELSAATQRFVGEIMQRPPAFSALKVGGRRAYDLARRGDAVELSARLIAVHSIELIGYHYPEFRLRVTCGSGTYIRSLGRDIAESLGTGAVMSALERTAIGHFRIETAVDPTALTHAVLAAEMVPLDEIVCHLPRLTLAAEQVRSLEHGKPLNEVPIESTGPIAALDDNGRLIAILKRTTSGELRSERVFMLR